MNRVRAVRIWSVVFSCAFVALFGLLGVAHLSDYYSSTKEDWRSAATYLKANAAGGDIVLADGDRFWAGQDHQRVEYAMSFYLARSGMEETPVLPITSGLAQALATNRGDGSAQPWAVLYHTDELAAARVQDEAAIADFKDVSVVRLRNPSGDLIPDTVTILEVLLNLLPAREAHFDIHLALAEIYLRTGQFEQAELELDKAAQVRPDHQQASRDLRETRAELDKLSCSVQNIEHPLWRNLGDVVAFLGYDIHTGSIGAGDNLALTLWWQGLAKMDRDYTVFIHVVDQDDRIWAQQDIVLQHGDYPTATWLPGETVRQEYQLELSRDMPPGEYTVKTGIYYWETGERLPVWDESGQRLAEDAIQLQHKDVTK